VEVQKIRALNATASCLRAIIVWVGSKNFMGKKRLSIAIAVQPVIKWTCALPATKFRHARISL